MRFDWIKKQDNSRLAVIMMGWACDTAPVRHIDARGYDILCIYDYRDIGDLPDATVRELAAALNGYDYRTLIAWSFGVWVAETLFGTNGPCPMKFGKLTALNGTPLPADGQYGIGQRRLAVSIRGLAKGGKEAFDRKTFGRWYEGLAESLSPRSMEDNIQELEVLTDLSSRPYRPTLSWTNAVVGTEDEIFPPENMLRYWADRAKTVPLPHYPFGESNILEELF